MKPSLFFLTLLLVPASIASGQAGASNPAQNNPQVSEERNQVAITGCLTKNSLNEYELVDQEGVQNLPYSATVKLDSYVGQEVTLIGRQSATPTFDTAGHSSPHFQVSKVQAAGKCDIP
jgi:hypothetical protein